MKVDPNARHLELVGDEGETLEIRYDVLGEPYRTGVTFALGANNMHITAIFVDAGEAAKIRDLLNTLFPVKP